MTAHLIVGTEYGPGVYLAYTDSEELLAWLENPVFPLPANIVDLIVEHTDAEELELNGGAENISGELERAARDEGIYTVAYTASKKLDNMNEWAQLCRENDWELSEEFHFQFC